MIARRAIRIIAFIAFVVYAEWFLNKAHVPLFAGNVILFLGCGVIFFVFTKLSIIFLVIGEHRQTPRPPVHRWAVFLTFALLFMPLALYFLSKDANASVTETAQLSVMVIAPTLGGLVLAAAALSSQPTNKRELIRVSQKFIAATVLFVFFAPSVFMLHLLHDADPYSFEWGREAISRGFWLWSSALSYYMGVALVLVGLVDLLAALVTLNMGIEMPGTRSDGVALTAPQPPGEHNSGKKHTRRNRRSP